MSFYAKSVIVGQMSEYLSIVIKSCWANFGGKGTSVFLNIKYGARMSILGKKKKKWNLVEKFWLFHQLCTTTESDYLFEKHAYF